MGKHLCSLAKCTEELRNQGILRDIAVGCAPHLEMAELAHRALGGHLHGQVLQFSRPVKRLGGKSETYEFPVLMNLYGSRERMLGVLRAESYEEVAERLRCLLAEGMKPRPRLSDKLRGLGVLAEMARYMPRKYPGAAPCQELRMEDPSFDRLPILQTWPADGGAFITLPMVITRDPRTGARNVGMYRMQVLDRATSGMHWHTHKTGANHYREYARRGERMPVVVALGGDPLLAYCATAPLPEGMDEWLLAGFLRREPVRMARALTCDLDVPAEADIILEGYVDPAEEKFLEGPFGDHTGFYSLEDWYPKFHLTCITHRRNAMYPATVVGVPPMEDAWIAEATEQIFKPLLQMSMTPELVDMWLPPMGVAHNLAVAALRTEYVGQPERIASFFWGAGQMMFTKYVLTVGADVPLRDTHTLLRSIARNVTGAKRLLFSRGPMDVLDHAAPQLGYGGKLLIDAQGDMPEGAGEVHWARGETSVSLWVDGVLLLHAVAGIPPETTRADEALLEDYTQGLEALPRCLALVDGEAPMEDPSLLLWVLLANTSPDRDVRVVEGAHSFSLLVDARAKSPRQTGRPWPNVVLSKEATRREVDARWEAYGVGDFIPSPSERLAAYTFSEGAEAILEQTE